VERVTADSNIYVSALRFGGKPLTLLEVALDGQIELAISDAILDETLGVLRDSSTIRPNNCRGTRPALQRARRASPRAKSIDAVP
jgi:hypothetical protein